MVKLNTGNCPPNALNRVYALVDCNNFYVSCERVFDPALKAFPVAVLSSIDGCVVARSNRVKALGIGMGEPITLYRDLVKENHVKLLTSNFALYGDISRRVMSILADSGRPSEVYSIDEAFLRLDTPDRTVIPAALTELAHKLRSQVRRWTGIPVSIGIAPTKTLAKLATHLAKREAAGVFNLLEVADVDEVLRQVPVGDIWGVGRKTEAKLVARGISNAYLLKTLDNRMVGKKMGLAGLRLVSELRGIACYSMHCAPQPNKGILSSGTFGRKIDCPELIKGAVARHVGVAARKLRRQKTAARLLTVFVHVVRPGRRGGTVYRASRVRLPEPTSNTPEMIWFALEQLGRLLRPGRSYRKAGIMLGELIPEDQVQRRALYARHSPACRGVMATIDQINHEAGKQLVRFAVQLPNHYDPARYVSRSPRYTTRWNELATAIAR